MNVCLNGLPLESGAWVRRSGTRFGAMTKSGLPGRVIQFTFKQQNPYTMEFTDGFLRFYSGYELAKTNDAQVITALSTQNPTVISTTTPHLWATGNTVMLDALAAGPAALHNRQCLITVTSTTSFTLRDAFTGANISGVAFGAFSGAGTVSRVLELATPYSAGAWGTVRSVQAETAAILLHPSIKPYVLSVTTPPTDTTDATFALAPALFQDGPYYDPFTNGVLATPSALTGIVNLTLSFAAYAATTSYDIGVFVTSLGLNYRSLITANLNNTPAASPTAWLAVSAASAIGPDGFQGSDIGRHIRLYSEPAIWAVGTVYAVGNVVAYQSAADGGFAYYTSLTAHTAALTNAPGVSLTTWGINATGALWTWGKITGLLNMIAAATGTSIGDMTANGGLDAAFDGATNQSSTACAAKSSGLITFIGGPQTVTVTGYVGKNYTASPQAVQFATLFPSSDQGLSQAVLGSGTTASTQPAVTINLRGNATLPGSASDGTLLGTSGVLSAIPLVPLTVQSSNAVTAWNFVWFEIVVAQTFQRASFTTGAVTVTNFVAEAQFYSPSFGGGNGVTAQILGPNLLYTTAIRTWRLGIYSDTLGWPTCGTYHEGRIWLAGSINNRLDASEPLDTNRPGVLNFRPTLSNGAVTASQAISYTLRSPDTNTILWMEPDQQGVIVGTEAGEWLVQSATNDGPITPLSIKARRVTKLGCANILPVKTENTTVFVQRYQQKTIEYFADVQSGKFSAPNLAATARHLTACGLEELAYQKELAPIIWARCTDGSLIGMTYKRESLISSQGPSFAGWHKHTLGSGRLVTSIAGGPSIGGLLDTLAMVTRDSVSGPYHVEFMADLWQETNDATLDGWLLDNAVVPTLTQNATVSTVACLQCLGMWHLAGLTVSVTVGGLDVGDHVVTATGVVNIPYSTTASPVADGLFTAAYVASLGADMSVVIGFTYTSDGQMVRPALQQESGARTGPGLGKVRRSHVISPLLVTTQGISFGTEFTAGKMNRANFETPGGTRYAQNRLFSGIFNVALTDSPSRDGMICWRITRPYPAMISAMPVALETVDQ